MDCTPGTKYKAPVKVELRNGSFYETPAKCDFVESEKPVQIVEKPVYVERRIAVPKNCKKVAKKRVTVKKALKKVAKNPVKTVKIVAKVVKKAVKTRKRSFRKRLASAVKYVRKRFTRKMV